MFQKLDQPFVVQGIEETLNIRVQYPIHSPPLDAHRQRIERLVSLPSRTETVAESPKVHLVYFIQDGHPLLNRYGACWTILSSSAAMPIGRCRPSAFGK